MKRNTFAGAVLLLSVLSVGSCDDPKDDRSQARDYLPLESVSVTFDVDLAPAEGDLSSLDFQWGEADRIFARVSGRTYSGPEASDVYTTQRVSGDKASFQGQMEYAEDRDIALVHSRAGTFVSASGAAWSGSVPSVQSGSVEGLRGQALFTCKVPRKGIFSEGGEYQFSATMHLFPCVLRLKIPDTLEAVKVSLDSSYPIAGTYTLDVLDYMLQRPVDGKSYSISIAAEETSLAGQQLYIMLAPDMYDVMTAEYYCGESQLCFTFYDSQGRVDRYYAGVQDRLYSGTLTNLGEVPDYVSFDKPAVSGSLYLMGDADLRVSVSDTSLLTSFYYEIGQDDQDCKTPTPASSERFYAGDGFPVPCTGSHDAWLVKVLVHSESPYTNDVILRGYIRNWNFTRDCPVTDAVARASRLLPKVGDHLSVDGMYLHRTNATDLAYVQYDDHMALRSCYLAMDAVVRNGSDAWLYFKVNRRLARGYKLYNNNATYGTTTINGYPVTASVTRDASEPYTLVPVVWHLGEVPEGFMAGVRGDGVHDYYSMALLETGPDVAPPAEAATQAALKMADGSQIPVVVLDSTAVASSLESGARYFFLASKDGFDAMGDPTIYDTPLPEDGLVVPFESAADSLYIKVLGRCDGRSDSYLRAVVRNWKFDKNFIAPTTLVSRWGDMDIKLQSYYSNDLVTDARIGYVGCNTGTAKVSPRLSGTGWVYANQFAGSFNGTVFSIDNDGTQIYRIAMPGATYYSGNPVVTSAPAGRLSPQGVVTFDWSYRIWLKDFALLETAPYTPSSYDDGGTGDGIEDFKDTIDY